MRQILIIDINGLGYASMYQPAFAKFKHNGESTAGLHGAMGSVIAMIKRYPTFTPVVLWDGRAQWRYDLVPGYKSNRSDDQEKIAIRESYQKQVPHIKRLLLAAGIPQLEHPSAEADDLSGMVCRELGGLDDVDIVMGSKDTDWWQGLDTNIMWYTNLTYSVMTLQDLKTEKSGPFSTTDQYVKAKALAGDTSDTIDGIPDIGLKTAAKILQDYGSVEYLWDKFDKGDKLTGERLRKVAGPEYRDLYKRNLQVIDWRLAAPVNLNQLTAQYQPADHVQMEAVAKEFNMTTLRAIVNSAGELPDYTDDFNFVFEAIEADNISRRADWKPFYTPAQAGAPIVEPEVETPKAETQAKRFKF